MPMLFLVLSYVLAGLAAFFVLVVLISYMIRWSVLDIATGAAPTSGERASVLALSVKLLLVSAIFYSLSHIVQ